MTQVSVRDRSERAADGGWCGLSDYFLLDSLLFSRFDSTSSLPRCAPGMAARGVCRRGATGGRLRSAKRTRDLAAEGRTVIAELERWVRAHRDEAVREWAEWIRQPSVSSDGTGFPAATDYGADLVRRCGLLTEVVQTG